MLKLLEKSNHIICLTSNISLSLIEQNKFIKKLLTFLEDLPQFPSLELLSINTICNALHLDHNFDESIKKLLLPKALKNHLRMSEMKNSCKL